MQSQECRSYKSSLDRCIDTLMTSEAAVKAVAVKEVDVKETAVKETAVKELAAALTTLAGDPSPVAS